MVHNRAIDNTYEMTESLSKVVGSHTMKFGFDWRRYEVNDSFDALNNGEFAFDGTGAYSTGDPGADFLLGIPIYSSRKAVACRRSAATNSTRTPKIAGR